MKIPGWRRSCTGGPVIPKEWEKSKKRISSRCGHFYSLEEPQATMDSRLRLAKRNADMRAYVKRRMEECQNG